MTGGRDCPGWPDEIAARYRNDGYWRGTALGAALRGWSRAHADRTALVAGPQRWSYAELDTWVDRVAAGLAQGGIRADERVLVQLPNRPELVVVTLALIRLGAQPVMALPAHRSHEMTALAELSEAVAYVVPESFGGFDYRPLAEQVQVAVPSVRQVIVDLPEAEPRTFPEPDPGSPALYLLSGGTTGTPKLIGRSHDDYLYNLTASAEVAGLDSSAVYLAVLPVAHNFALACPGVLGTLSVGGTVVLAETANPNEAFAVIALERVTVTALVPSLALLWMEALQWGAADLSSLEVVQVGGAKLTPEAALRVQPELGCRLQQVFGMAEGLLCFTRLDDPDDLVVHTQGRPLAAADEVRVVDEDDVDVPLGEEGALLTRGPYTPRGYFRAPEHNARAFTADGFYRSGDLVRQTASGHLVVSGRAKDVINRGGEKVSAELVEDHLLTHPDVLEAAVVAMPDDILGERTCAFLITRGGAPTVRDVAAHLRARGAADFQLPDKVVVVDAFPRTPVGKVAKKELAYLTGTT